MRFSLVRGGLLYRLLRKGHLLRDDSRDPVRTSIAAVLFTWVPLMVAAALERVVTGSWDLLAKDFSVHGRLLVAVPLLLFADSSLHMRTGRCIERFTQNEFAATGNEAVETIARRAETLRDAVAPEVGFLIVALIAGQVLLWNMKHSSGFLTAATTATMTPVRAWYGFVALPLVIFLALRALWRWVIWTLVLWKLSRLTLRTEAIHPDQRGGLSFLCEPTVGFALYAAALSVLCASGWAMQHVWRGTPITAFGGTFCVLIFVCFLLIFGPLFFFTPSLWRTRLDGIRQYDTLALDYARLFHHKWVGSGDTTDLLGSADIQSMADMSNSYEVVKKMKAVPIELGVVLVVFVAMVIPMIPLFLMQVPLPELLRNLSSSMMGRVTG
jgi:hypothetical protein